VAERLHVSASHLSRLFHHSAGLPFNEYLTRLRTEQAKKLLLTTSRNVTEIAYDSGFQSISQFNRAFKAVHGVSPRSLRARVPGVANVGAKDGAAPARQRVAGAAGGVRR
jgi:AraC-like DNA-binding protein